MKNLSILLCITIAFLGFTHQAKAQCKPCPERFMVTDSGCTHIMVIGQPAQPPAPAIYIPTDTIRACQGSKFTYNINPNFPPCNYPGITYSYSVSNGTLVGSSGSQFTIQWGNSPTGSVTVSFNIPSGPNSERCTGSFTILSKLFPKPIPAFTIAPNPACLNNQPICFNASASIGAVSYFWDFGDGFQGTGLNPCHTYSTPGTYIVTLVAAGGPFGGGGQPGPSCPACVDSVKQTVTIYTLPGPPIDSCRGTVCAGEESTYCTPVPPGCGTYVWTVTGGTITSGQGTPCITVTWGSGNPQGSITLQIIGCPTYCTQGTTVSIPIIPATTTITGSAIACINTSATYSLPVWPGTSYNWTLSGGGTIVGNNTNTNYIAINWTSAGSFTITCNYYDSAKDCGGVGTLTVNVLPVASITGNNSFCAGASTTLTTAGFTSSWSISPAGASITPSGPSATVTSNTPGTYTVTATPTSPLACNAPTYTVTVLPKPLLGPITGQDSICKGQTYIYGITSNTIGTFTWNVANGSFVNLGTFNDSVQVTWNNSGGPYTLSVTQTGGVSGCISDPATFTVYPYPTPVISGALNVCADATATYTITNIGNHPFNWSVSPGNLGTIITGQGSNQVQIKWHGSNTPGSSNLVYLKVGFCQDDSIAITINEPVLPVITATGTLCGGGVNLSVAATGTFSWSCTEHAIIPTQPTNLSSLTGLTLPGHYTVTISNYNGTGCTVSATYFVPDIGRPTASISASNVLNYCLPALPNMNLVAAYTAGYQFQWYQAPSTPIGGLTTNPVLPINTLTAPGSYTYYCVVFFNGCQVTSNSITINIASCPGGGTNPGCSGGIGVTSITGCNPFTFSLFATAPIGGTIVPGTTVISYTNLLPTSGNTTATFDSVGYKQIRICADIAIPGGGTTRCCKDTVVLVTVASKFLANESCGVVTLTDLSTVIFPSTISSYAWTNGSNPGNLSVPVSSANFNNAALQNPVDTLKVSGSYIITQTITSGVCTVSSMDTLNVVIPNATFTAGNSCVGTPINLLAMAGFTSYFWDFGDAATSYSQGTSHAYAAPGLFTISLQVTDSNGCSDTVSQVVNILPAPTCTLTVSGPTTFCAGGSVVLQSCAGLTGYQWYNNGVAIPLQTNQTFTALQTGNYYCTALNANNCLVMSDTVSVLVNAAPPANVTLSGSKCLGGTFTFSVPPCATCTYFWTNNGNPIPGAGNSGSFTIGPAAIGPHTFVVTVTNTATGCTATGTASVTFYNPPTVSISVLPNVALLCSNNPYLLTATTSASSPLWAWNFNNTNFVISSTNSVTANAAGTYNVFVTDGITGCTATASQVVNPSPDLALFPSGCDTLCDTSRVFLPLGSINNNLAGYTITWYDNAPPYSTILGSGPVLLLGSPLAPGNHSLSVIVISPNGCADTSNNYKIFVKPCTGCDCDSSKWGPLTWEYAPNDLPAIGGSNANNSIGNANNNNNNNKPKEIICGKDLGNIDCTKPILIKGSFLCNPSSCDTLVKYTLTGPVTGTGYLPFSTSGLPAGSYVLILEGKCGDSICKVCDIPFTITCDTLANCCAKSYWEEPLRWNGGTPSSVFPVVIGTPIDCKKSNFVISDELGNCKTPVTITGTFVCGSNCPPKVVFNLFNTVSNTLVATSTGMLAIPLSLPNGSYSVTVYAYCGDKICDSCKFTFTKKCDDCCTNSHWVKGPSWKTGEDNPTGGGGISTPIICGKSEFSINDAIGNCKTPITISGVYACGANCPPKVVYNLYNTAGNTLVSTSTGSLVIPVSLPNGSYSVTIYAYCGDKICDSCKFTFTKKCDDCCTNSHWVKGPSWKTGGDNPTGGGGISTPIICGKSVFNINDVLGNCNTPITISGTYSCGSNCPPKVVYNLYNTITNTLVTSVTGSLVIPVSLPNGSYSVTIYAYCGDKICDSCKFTIIKKCTPCNCDQGKPISVSITTNEVTKKYNCGAKLPVIECKSNVVMNGSYTCKPANCPAALTYQLTGPYGTTTGTLPITLSALAPGNYTIILNAYCNNILCKECRFTFTVKCDGLPPKECCPYPITVKPSVPTYQLMENSSASIVNQQFNFTGLTGVQLSEVKAEVLSYNLSSNFENECLGCKSKPFTWASVQSAGNIGAVVPKITLFGGFTTPLFNPTGTAVYQNPREVIWNNGSPFLLAGPIGINFIVPPPSLIDCCVLSGKICVKFTFRDTKCRECEVIACFEFNISKDMKVNYVKQ
jgi:hypothetical protein